MSVIIRFKNIKKGFKKKVILDNVNLSIEKNEIFGIIGMSGSGKTTLLNMLIGFLDQDAGNIAFYSEKNKKYESVFTHPIEVGRTFGFATQAASFYPKLTVQENLLHFGALYNISKITNKLNASHLLHLTELYESKDILSQDLSGGMEKKLSVACALIHHPKVLILDEPTADLDPISRDETWKLIREINKNGTTVIVASHFISELERNCDRVGILYNKKVMAVDSPKKLRIKYKKQSLIKVFESLNKKNAKIK